MEFHAYLAALPRLDAVLRREGIAAGPDVWQNVYDLLDRLRQQGRWPSAPEQLVRMLGPLLCRTPTQQAVFSRLHDEALTGRRPVPEPAIVASEPGATLRGWRERLAAFDRRWRAGAVALAAALLALIALVVLWPPNPVKFDADRIREPAPGNPEPVENGEPLPKSDILIVDRVSPNRLPQPEGFPEPWRKWQSRIGYAAWGLPWLVPVFWLARRAARRLRFRRARSQGRTPLRDLRFALPLHPLFGGPEAERDLSGLRPVVFRSSRKLDVTATAEATAHHAGYVQLRFRTRRATPMYLLLVRGLDRDDQRAALAEELAARFRELGIEVGTYRFRDDPRWLVLWEAGKPPHTLELATLAREYPDAGLIVLSEAEILFHPLTGDARPWLDAFRDWPRRIWLHPRDVSLAHAEALWLHAFLVLPQARHALRPLAHWLTREGESLPPPAVADALPLPALLADDPESWLAPHPPYGVDASSLPWQLERFLGTHGLLLLQAIMIYPEPRWPLTLALDYLLFSEHDDAGSFRREQRLSRLSRLPWLRHACLPQHVRELLLADLQPDDRERICEAWTRLFGQLTDGHGRLSLTVATPTIGRLRAMLRDMIDVSNDAALRDPIFLDLLSGGRLGRWDIPISTRIARLLPGRPRWLDLRILPLIAAAGLSGWGLAAAWHVWGRPWLTGIWQQRIAADNARWPVLLKHGPATAELAAALDDAVRRAGHPVSVNADLGDATNARNIVRSGVSARDAAERLAQTLKHITYGAEPLMIVDPGIPSIEVDLGQTHQAGAVFRDPLTSRTAGTFSDALRSGGRGPVMVKIPAGSFTMGSPETEQGRGGDEGPQHRVSISSFALGRYELTFDEYDEFARATGRDLPDDRGWGRGERPVINVSWDDARAYADWLSQETGEPYRLPSEAEWEYAARAGTNTRRYWGDDPGDDQACRYANVVNSAKLDQVAKVYSSAKDWPAFPCDDPYPFTAPVGSFTGNAFGLQDMLGNVWEWVEDCLHDSYQGAPADGSAWVSGDCGSRVLRGGSWGYGPGYIRAADRFWGGPVVRDDGGGFRLARDLP